MFSVSSTFFDHQSTQTYPLERAIAYANAEMEPSNLKFHINFFLKYRVPLTVFGALANVFPSEARTKQVIFFLSFFVLLFLTKPFMFS